MGNIGTVYANVALDALYGDDHIDGAPDTWWLALFKTEPGNDASGQELDAGVEGGYVRTPIANTSENFPAASNAVKTLAPQLSLPTPLSTNWGVVPYWALMDTEAQETGDVSAWGRLGGVSPPQIEMGSILYIPAGTLIIKMRRSLFA